MLTATTPQTNHSPSAMPSGSMSPAAAPVSASVLAHYQIIRRNGAVVSFEPSKIAVAMMKAFLAVHGTQGAASASVRETVDELTQAVVRALMRSRPGGGTFHIEDVQDQVELGLMRSGHHEVARAYVLYRERRTRERATQVVAQPVEPLLHVIDRGQRVPLDLQALQDLIANACAGLGADVKPEPIVAETKRNLYDGVPIEEVYKASILAARTLIEKDPDYTYATARLLLHTIVKEVMGEEVPSTEMGARYADYFPQFIKKGVDNELLDEKLLQFDLARLGAALKPERDLQFDYLGLQTLYDRYFLHVRKSRIELPQAFFMRVAMGLSLNEAEPTKHAIAFYEKMSKLEYLAAGSTLVNAGTSYPQLSNCFVMEMQDDIEHIAKSVRDVMWLTKGTGGIGLAVTKLRAQGSPIRSNNTTSTGPIPFMHTIDSVLRAVTTPFMWALGLGMGLCSAIPSLILKQPVMVAWSTPGAAVVLPFTGTYALSGIAVAMKAHDWRRALQLCVPPHTHRLTLPRCSGMDPRVCAFASLRLRPGMTKAWIHRFVGAVAG
mgnify:CR=1 FL=1